MAKATAESEEEFNDQFILDDDMDDLSLDDDALFADLDNEIRLDGDTTEDAGAEAPGDDIPDLGLDTDSTVEAGGGDSAGDDLGDMGMDGGDSAAGDGEDLDISLEADAEPGAESADVDFDLDGEDIGRLDLGSEDGLDDFAGGGDGLDDLVIDEVPVDDGLDDLVIGDEPAGGSSGDVDAEGDGLDDLVIDEAPVDDGQDDLVIGDSPSQDETSGLDLDIGAAEEGSGGLDLDIGAAEDEAGDMDIDIGTSEDDMNNLEIDDGPAGDDMGNIMADGEGISDSDLDDILDTEESVPGEDFADISDGDLDDILVDDAGTLGDSDDIDLNAFEDELTLEDDGDGAESISVEEDLGDLDLSLGPDEVSHDISGEDGDSGGADDLFLGEEELEVPPIEDGDPLQAAVADLSLDGVDDMELDALEIDVGDAIPGVDEAEDYSAAPDMDISQLDAQLDALDSSILEEEPIDEGEELPIEFSQEELVEMGAEDGLEMPPYEPVAAGGESDFSAVADIDLEEEGVLELNLDNIDSSGQTFSNVSIPPILDYADAADTGAPQTVQPAGISTEILLSIPHQVNVEMGSVAMNGKDILELDYGSVVPLNRGVGEPVNLVLEGKAIAQGEIVLINGKSLGVRIVAVSK